MGISELTEIMVDFCEEYWAAFLQRCLERGYDEEEVEAAISNYRENLR